MVQLTSCDTLCIAAWVPVWVPDCVPVWVPVCVPDCVASCDSDWAAGCVVVNASFSALSCSALLFQLSAVCTSPLPTNPTPSLTVTLAWAAVPDAMTAMAASALALMTILVARCIRSVLLPGG